MAPRMPSRLADSSSIRRVASATAGWFGSSCSVSKASAAIGRQIRFPCICTSLSTSSAARFAIGGRGCQRLDRRI